MNLSRLQRDTAGHSCGIVLMARRIGVLAALVIGLAVALDLGHAVGGSAITVQTSADSTYAMHLEQEVTLRVSLSAAPPTGQTVMVRMGVASERISRVVQYSAGQGAHKQNQVLVFTAGNWNMGRTVTIRAIGAGRVALTSEIITGGGAWSQRTAFSRVEVQNNNAGVSIKIAPKDGSSWIPLILEDDRPFTSGIGQPFDHVMGEAEQITYQVSIVDPAACPAQVKISGKPRYRNGTRHWGEAWWERFNIRAGSPKLQQESRIPKPEISETLDFPIGTDGTCTNMPKDVTVYGIADTPWSVAGKPGYGNIHFHPSYVLLEHTLIKRGTTGVSEPGPVFRLYGEDRYLIEMAGAVPSYSGDTNTLPRRKIMKHGASRKPSSRWSRHVAGPERNPYFANNVGPYGSTKNGIRTINDGDEIYVYLPQAASTTSKAPWVEFCVYIQGFENTLREDETYGFGMVSHEKPYWGVGVGLSKLTPVPFEYEQLNWYAFWKEYQLPLGREYNNSLADRVNTHYGFPIELQWYSDPRSNGRGCNPVDTSADGYAASNWKTVYAGGPATLQGDGSPSSWTIPTDSFELPLEHWGKMINVRMRAAYGLPRAQLPERWRIPGGNESTFDATIVADSGGTYSYRSPQGTMLLKFTFEELGAQSDGSIVVLFGDPPGGG